LRKVRIERLRPTPLSWAYSVCSYADEKIKEVIWEIKYKGNRKIISEVTPILHEAIMSIVDQEAEAKFTKIILCYVPSHWGRKNEKGFNQGKLMVTSLKKLFPEYKTDLKIKKIKKTSPQTKLDKHKRLTNLKNAFMAKIPEKYQNSESLFVIIDDVITTGATMTEIRKTLKKAGAKNVIGVAVGH